MNWDHTVTSLDACGFAVVEHLLDAAACREIAAMYLDDQRFRSHVVMARHGVSTVRAGHRHTAGIIFHDAR